MSDDDMDAAVQFLKDYRHLSPSFLPSLLIWPSLGSAELDVSQEKMLKFYAWLKQYTEGTCTKKAPSRINMVEYEKWKAHKVLGILTVGRAAVIH